MGKVLYLVFRLYLGAVNRQRNIQKFAFFTRKHRSHVGNLETWFIKRGPVLMSWLLQATHSLQHLLQKRIQSESYWQKHMEWNSVLLNFAHNRYFWCNVETVSIVGGTFLVLLST